MSEDLFDPLTGRFDRGAIMRKAVADHRAWRHGGDGFDLSYFIRAAWRVAKGRRDAAHARGDFVRASMMERLAPDKETVERVFSRMVPSRR